MVAAARLRCSRSVRPSGLFTPDIDIPFEFRKHGLQSIKLRCLIGKVAVMALGRWFLCCYLIMIKYIIGIKYEILKADSKPFLPVALIPILELFYTHKREISK